ncbi:MAG: hypothetical protein HWE23_11075 [Rhodobacteraceae bacterium]|nr:hypothetical protein [Paracoccaceae bacterium]
MLYNIIQMCKVFACRFFLIIAVFCQFSTVSLSSEIKPIYPSWSVENKKLRDFVVTIVNVYLFYGSMDKRFGGEPTFIFLSGQNYLEDGHLSYEVASDFFPSMSKEEIEFFTGKSDVCLVFNIPLKQVNITVGVNNTKKDGLRNLDFRCFLDSISFFLDGKDNYKLYSDDIREYARNFIERLRSNY